MKNPFKSKTGEEQSLLRLAVIAGNTLVVLAVLGWMLNRWTGMRPLNRTIFDLTNLGGQGGWLLVLAGTIVAAKKGNPIKKAGIGGLLLGLGVVVLDNFLPHYLY